ncbi:antibiotic biosynthesis monooxygenase family protein [Pseudomonas sp. RIT-PI-AD]|uniref:antibiotic biosynthesis monooxygenase family protein n=1 Tax=Pseudomonas sp. RIT-PI-AD TaxID=3035294 RepID=UPI0021DA8C77|nr:antibiotic biosynthesis monooxygenase family protein [Pseudomonas sp. RIT-PI-AD]
MGIEQYLSGRGRPGHEAAIAALLQRLARLSRDVPGCLECELHLPDAGRAEWWLRANWASATALWRATATAAPLLDELLRDHCLHLRAGTTAEAC